MGTCCCIRENKHINSNYNICSNEIEKLKELQNTIEKREIEKSKELQNTIGKGLINEGNKCYMNSILQILLHNEDLRNKVMKFNKSTNINTINYLYELIENLFDKSNGKKGVSPINFISEFSKSNPKYQYSNQEDSHEFLLLVLSHLNSEFKKINNNNINEIDELFEVSLQNKLKCKENHIRGSSQEEYSISIEIDSENFDKKIIIFEINDVEIINYKTNHGILIFYQDLSKIIDIINKAISKEIKSIYYIVSENTIEKIIDFTHLNELIKNQNISKFYCFLQENLQNLLLIQHISDNNTSNKILFPYIKSNQTYNNVFKEINIYIKEEYYLSQLDDEKCLFCKEYNCKKCVKIEQKNKNFVIMQIKTKKNFFKKPKVHENINMTIYDMLMKFEKIEEENLELPCIKCNSPSQIFSQQIFISKTNKYLIFHLKRSKNKKKIIEELYYPLNNFQLSLIDKKEELDNVSRNRKYFLSSIVLHYGSSTKSGHYISYILNKNNNKWYLYNDEMVSKISNIDNITHDSNATILFYEVIN